MIKKRYKNIIEFTRENNIYDSLCEGFCGIGRSLEDYLDDYSDRNIVLSLLTDIRTKSDDKFKFRTYPRFDKTHVNVLDWRNTEILIE